MTELLTSAQMRAIEQAAIASGKVTGLELMERAGRGVVEAIFEEWPELAPSWGPAPKPFDHVLRDHEVGLHRAVVLCGPGNNGGDGFVVARLLKECGWDVEVFLYGDAEKLPPDARVNYERWLELGEVEPFSELDGLAPLRNALTIDALFGTGLSRPLDMSALGEPTWKLTKSRARVVAIDAVSGIDLDSGKAIVDDERGFAPNADLTTTFHKAKVGHFLEPFVTENGSVRVVDIGLEEFDRQEQEQVELIYSDYIDVGVEKFPGDTKTHKYSYGHALILSGGPGKGGAARLAARGALRIGAGAVTVGCSPEALAENAAQLNAIMLQAVGDVGALDAILSDARINALCVGPGLGLENSLGEMLEAVLESGRAIVLDADALTLLARDAALFSKLHDKCVLTPHAGEFARLFPDIAEKLNAPATKGPAYSKVDATREAATRAGCVVLFKGPDTVIADPAGRCSINASVYDRSAPWLATAGSGDVLAGYITGLLARGYAPMPAAESGAWLHTECALSFGPGLIAEDLSEELPKVLRNIGV